MIGVLNTCHTPSAKIIGPWCVLLLIIVLLIGLLLWFQTTGLGTTFNNFALIFSFNYKIRKNQTTVLSVYILCAD